MPSRKVQLIMAVALLLGLVGVAAAVVGPRLFQRATPLHTVGVGGDVVPIPEGWQAATPPLHSDIILIAREPGQQGEETVRRGAATESMADSVSGYMQAFKFERPNGLIKISHAVKVNGANPAWLLETIYTAELQGQGKVEVWAIDVFAHASDGEDLHLILVSRSQSLVDGALSNIPILLSLGHPTRASPHP